MSKKPEETKEKAAKAEEKPEETKEQAGKAEEKSEETEEKAAKAEEQPEEAKEKAAKAEGESEETKEKPSTAKEKPLEKMTVKELREMAKDIPGITGVHAMKKDELIVELKKAKGIKDEPVKKADANIADLKQKIKALKAQRRGALEAKDKKNATIFKRRISRLKKRHGGRPRREPVIRYWLIVNRDRPWEKSMPEYANGGIFEWSGMT